MKSESFVSIQSALPTHCLTGSNDNWKDSQWDLVKYASSFSHEKDELPSKSIIVPVGWKRVVLSKSVIYFSPSGVQLKSLSEIRTYLATEGTCKCGLECALHVNSTFDFDYRTASETWNSSRSEPLYCNHKIQNNSSLSLHSQSPFFNEKKTHSPVAKRKKKKKITTNPNSNSGDVETSTKQQDTEINSRYDSVMHKSLSCEEEKKITCLDEPNQWNNNNNNTNTNNNNNSAKVLNPLQISAPLQLSFVNGPLLMTSVTPKKKPQGSTTFLMTSSPSSSPSSSSSTQPSLLFGTSGTSSSQQQLQQLQLQQLQLQPHQLQQLQQQQQPLQLQQQQHQQAQNVLLLAGPQPSSMCFGNGSTLYLPPLQVPIVYNQLPDGSLIQASPISFHQGSSSFFQSGPYVMTPSGQLVPSSNVLVMQQRTPDLGPPILSPKAKIKKTKKNFNNEGRKSRSKAFLQSNTIDSSGLKCTPPPALFSENSGIVFQESSEDEDEDPPPLIHHAPKKSKKKKTKRRDQGGC